MSAYPPTSRICRACGRVVVPDAPLGHCPKCLAKLGLVGLKEDPKADAEVPPAIFSTSNRFADYTLLRQIGRGSMGVVYEARHLQLHRSVALKVILDSELASPVARRWFRIEAEAAAKLDHRQTSRHLCPPRPL